MNSCVAETVVSRCACSAFKVSHTRIDPDREEGLIDKCARYRAAVLFYRDGGTCYGVLRCERCRTLSNRDGTGSANIASQALLCLWFDDALWQWIRRRRNFDLDKDGSRGPGISWDRVGFTTRQFITTM